LKYVLQTATLQYQKKPIEMMNYLKLVLGLLAIFTTPFFVSCSDDQEYALRKPILK